MNTDEEVVARFPEVGGVPRHIQNAAISALTATQATQILHGRLDVVGSFANHTTRSLVIGYAKPKMEGKYCLGFFRQVKLISPLVEEKVVSKVSRAAMCGVP